jgi:hypothetical protein
MNGQRKSRPFCRWKSFWLGILVLGFIGWAWGVSMDGIQSLTYKPSSSPSAYVAYNGLSGVTVFSSDNETFRGISGIRTRAVPSEIAAKEVWSNWFPLGIRTRKMVSGDHWRLRFAHWFLMLLFSLVWSAWLFFHWKREQRKFSASANLMKATPRRLIRWKSFWLGILVLGFLSCSWVRSMHEMATFVPWTESQLSLQSVFGRLNIAYIGPSVPQYDAGLTLEDGMAPDPEDYPPSAVAFLKSDFTTEVNIAHWLLILLFLVPWVSFLAWRWRRQRKLTETNPLS